MSRGKGTDNVSLRTDDDWAASNAIQEVHQRSQQLYEKALSQHAKERSMLGITAQKPAYIEVADKELDDLLFTAFDQDNYDYIRSLLRQYGQTEAVPAELMLLDDYDLVRGEEWAAKTGKPLMVGLRAWARAQAYLPKDAERYELERAHLSRADHVNGAGFVANSLHEIIASALLQRGSLDYADDPGYDIKPWRAVRIEARSYAPYRHLQELGEKDIIYVRAGNLESPLPAHKLDYGYLYLYKDEVVGMGYGPYQPPQITTQLPENSRLTIHQARRYLDPLTVIELNGVMIKD